MDRLIIHFPNERLKAIWDNELVGQISDGYWENSRPYDHWKEWTDAKSVVGGFGVEGWEPYKRNYNFTASDLIDIVGDRMIGYVKMSQVDKSHIGAGEYLEELIRKNPDITIEEVKKEKNSYNELGSVTKEKLEKFKSIKYNLSDLKKDLKTIKDVIRTDYNPSSSKEFPSIEPSQKDKDRIKSIIKRANGDEDKELILASNMANSIDSIKKAVARMNAAKESGEDKIAEVFKTRAEQLQESVAIRRMIKEEILNIMKEKKSNKHFFSAAEKRELLKKHQILPDGSFPIRNKQDLKDACRSMGRTKNKGKAKSWIVYRARQLNALDLLPETWDLDKIKPFDSSVFKESIKRTNIEILKEKLEMISGKKIILCDI